jgi:hypothetical protein
VDVKKFAGLATTAAVLLAVTGCAAAGAAPLAQSAAPSPTPTSIYEAVWQGWEGLDRPDERWIDTAAMLACKQIIGGIEPRVVRDHPGNNELVVSAAEDFLCEVDR